MFGNTTATDGKSVIIHGARDDVEAGGIAPAVNAQFVVQALSLSLAPSRSRARRERENATERIHGEKSIVSLLRNIAILATATTR